MRHHLPSNRLRRLGALVTLAALVALATIGLQAHADTELPAPSQSIGAAR